MLNLLESLKINLIIIYQIKDFNKIIKINLLIKHIINRFNLIMFKIMKHGINPCNKLKASIEQQLINLNIELVELINKNIELEGQINHSFVLEGLINNNTELEGLISLNIDLHLIKLNIE